MGNADGAGDAWKVAPAKAAADPALADDERCKGGVWRSTRGNSGDAAGFFDFGLFLFFCFEPVCMFWE
jgi:hypothetical protein